MIALATAHLRKHWKAIAAVYLLFLGAVSGILILLPNVYTSQALYFPLEPEEDAGTGGLLALARARAGLNLGSGPNPVLIFKEMIGTWTFADTLASVLDAEEMDVLFRQPLDTSLQSRARVLRWCKKNLKFSSSAISGIVALKVSAPTPSAARGLAYKITDILNRANAEMNRERLAKQIFFLEKSIKDVRGKLNDRDLQLVKLERSNLGVNSPEIQYQRVKLVREQKILEETFSILESQMVDAEIKRQKNIQTLRYMERPTYPAEKDRPKRKIILIVALAGLASLHLAGWLLWANRNLLHLGN